MGQRTATLVSYIDEKGKHNKVYYNQWGIGRVQLNAFMGSFLSQLGKEGLDLDGACNMRLETGLKGVENTDFTDIKVVANIISQMDNNNGGVVIICHDEEPRKAHCEIGFVLGSEETITYDSIREEYVHTEPLYSRFVPFDEWAEKVGGSFVDESYKAMFRAFCTHFHCSVIGEPKKGGEQWD